MTDLEQLIDTCDKLCATLTVCAQNEKDFSFTLQSKLETMSWEIWRTTNDLKEIIETFGV